jgi:hypothetical protein
MPFEADEDQKQRSRYISLFRMPGGVAESLFQGEDYQRLRGVYQGKLAESAIIELTLNNAMASAKKGGAP